MENNQHTAFYIGNNDDKDQLIKMIKETDQFKFSLNGLQGEIFSNNTLEYFINEEIKHGHFDIKTANDNTLTLSSSGEKRKALLNNLLAKKRDYIILDNVFESLDIATRTQIMTTICSIATSTLIIQIFNQKDELLPFIENVYLVDGQTISACQSRFDFILHAKLKTNILFNGTIPAPLETYALQTDALIKLNNVNVSYDGKPILNNICWQINAGEFWQLKGPNGSGKSTLLSLITGDSPKGYGEDLKLFGKQKGSGETVWELKQKIGYFTPDITAQFERLDTIEQMVIAGFFDSVGLYIQPSDRQVQLAGEWLHILGLYPDRKTPFKLFSSGIQRMILIARAMIKHPPLLILDEPTAGLDDAMTVLFTNLINKIAAETTTAIVYVSHRIEQGLCADKTYELVATENGSIGLEK